MPIDLGAADRFTVYIALPRRDGFIDIDAHGTTLVVTPEARVDSEGAMTLRKFVLAVVIALGIAVGSIVLLVVGVIVVGSFTAPPGTATRAVSTPPTPTAEIEAAAAKFSPATFSAALTKLETLVRKKDWYAARGMLHERRGELDPKAKQKYARIVYVSSFLMLVGAAALFYAWKDLVVLDRWVFVGLLAVLVILPTFYEPSTCECPACRKDDTARQ